MNTRHLECFMAVANFMSFCRAAEQLRLTQPAVSHKINTLEDELGVKLFYRTSKRVRLTQAGHLFSQYAREILSLSRMSKARLKEGQDSSVLRFGIGCRSFLELRLLGPVLGQLREEFPQLMPVLRLVPFDSVGGSGVLPAFRPERVCRLPEKKPLPCYVALWAPHFPAGEFHALYNPDQFP